jgi:hypothetical protein
MAVGMLLAALSAAIASVSRQAGMAQAAADAAALAAAGEQVVPSGRSPAAVAATYARSGDVRLIACRCPRGGSEAVVTVETSVEALGTTRTIRRTARAVARLDAGWGGLRPGFAAALGCLFSRVPGLTLVSGFRTAEEQARLHREKPGLAAPPGHSAHEVGLAADLGFASIAVRSDAHAAAPACGLRFPLPHEPWHVEPVAT